MTNLCIPTVQVLMSVQALMLAVVALSNRQYSYPQLLLRWGLFDQSLWTYGHAWGKSPIHARALCYRASEGKRFQQPTLRNHPKLTSSSVHHSSHQWSVLFFYRITMSHNKKLWLYAIVMMHFRAKVG